MERGAEGRVIFARFGYQVIRCGDVVRARLGFTWL